MKYMNMRGVSLIMKDIGLSCLSNDFMNAVLQCEATARYYLIMVKHMEVASFCM